MNADYYRLIGFLDMVTTMLGEKDLASPNAKKSAVSLERQLSSAKKILVAEGLKLQRANAEFEANVKSAREVIADVMTMLRQANQSTDPLVAAHFEEFSNPDAVSTQSASPGAAGKTRRLGGGDDCSSSIKTTSPAGGSSSGSTSTSTLSSGSTMSSSSGWGSGAGSSSSHP